MNCELFLQNSELVDLLIQYFCVGILRQTTNISTQFFFRSKQRLSVAQLIRYYDVLKIVTSRCYDSKSSLRLIRFNVMIA